MPFPQFPPQTAPSGSPLGHAISVAFKRSQVPRAVRSTPRAEAINCFLLCMRITPGTMEVLACRKFGGRRDPSSRPLRSYPFRTAGLCLVDKCGMPQGKGHTGGRQSVERGHARPLEPPVSPAPWETQPVGIRRMRVGALRIAAMASGKEDRSERPDEDDRNVGTVSEPRSYSSTAPPSSEASCPTIRCGSLGQPL